MFYFSDPSGWWQGKKSNGEVGLFPGAYVEKMILPKKLITARVVYSYAATDTDKISISENEVIEILKEGEFS